MLALPQSTPIKSMDTTPERRPSLTLSLMTPESAVVRSHTKRSLSGVYLAHTPTWTFSEVKLK